MDNRYGSSASLEVSQVGRPGGRPRSRNALDDDGGQFPSSNLPVVGNTWRKRAGAQVAYTNWQKWRKLFFWALLALCVVALVVALAVYESDRHQQDTTPRLVAAAAPAASSSTSAELTRADSSSPAATKAPSTSSTSTPTLSSGSSTSSSGATTVSATPSPSNTICDATSFEANVTFVGVYDPSVDPEQFKTVSATGDVDCCQTCFALEGGGICNGWGWMNNQCTIVYGYPGTSSNDTCPQGYPSVTISVGGDTGSFGGLGPCALQ